MMAHKDQGDVVKSRNSEQSHVDSICETVDLTVTGEKSTPRRQSLGRASAESTADREYTARSSLSSNYGPRTPNSDRGSHTTHSTIRRHGSAMSATSTSSRAWLSALVSLEETALLRGVDLGKVMDCYGKVFQNSAGSNETYNLSEAVDSIDDFLSHNWTTGRMVKVLALSLHYNIHFAGFCTLLVAVTCMLLQWAGIVPLVYLGSRSMGFAALVFGSSTFFIVLCGLHTFPKGCCRRCRSNRTVFLDKVCIHQTDRHLQKKGIQSLAGFLHASERLVIVYQRDYLRRLWTVYEVASFLMIHQNSDKITMLSTFWTRQFLAITLSILTLGLLYLTTLAVASSGYLNPAVATQTYYLTVLLSLLAFNVSVRRWQKHKGKIEETIKNFSIRKCACAVEADRDLVKSNVCTFMRYLGRITAHGPQAEEEALDEFDMIVREELPESLGRSFGRFGYTYSVAVASAGSFILFAFDDVGADLYHGTPVPVTVVKFVYTAGLSFALIPLATCILSWMLCINPRNTNRFFEVLIIFASVIPCLFVFGPWNTLFSLALAAPDEKTLIFWMTVQLIVFGAIWAITFWVYNSDPAVPITTRVANLFRSAPRKLEEELDLVEVKRDYI